MILFFKSFLFCFVHAFLYVHLQSSFCLLSSFLCLAFFVTMILVKRDILKYSTIHINNLIHQGTELLCVCVYVCLSIYSFMLHIYNVLFLPSKLSFFLKKLFIQKPLQKNSNILLIILTLSRRLKMNKHT